MRRSTKKKLIFIRYVLPPVALALVPIFMLIPSYRYVTAGELRDSTSAFSLLVDSFADSRQILFDGGKHTVADTSFSGTMFTLSIVLPILYLLALAAAIYCTAVAMRYFLSADEKSAEKSRTLFITFFPNRICISAAQMLALPIMLLPYFMPYLFKNAYKMNVSLVLGAPDALILGGTLLLGAIVLCIITAPMERALSVDLFEKKQTCMNEEENEDGGDDAAYTRSEEAPEREERINRIRELLGQKNDDKKEDDI